MTMKKRRSLRINPMSKLISIAMWLAAALAVFPSATLHAQPADGFVIVSGSAA
jgi:hypothetical protein